MPSCSEMPYRYYEKKNTTSFCLKNSKSVTLIPEKVKSFIIKALYKNYITSMLIND